MNWFLRGTAWSQPSTIYFGLDSTIADAASGGVEISGTGYARQAGSVGGFTSRQVSNDASMTWTPGTTWPEAQGFRIWDAPTGGNVLGFGGLSPKPTPTAGSPYTLAAGEATIICDGAYTAVSTWFLQKLLEKIFDNTANASISGSLNFHLVNIRSSIAGTGGTAVSGTGYSSKTGTFAAWASGRNYVASDITFSASTGGVWTTANGWELWTNATFGSGNLVFSLPLSPTFSIGAGVPVVLKSSLSYVGLIGVA